MIHHKSFNYLLISIRIIKSNIIVLLLGKKFMVNFILDKREYLMDC